MAATIRRLLSKPDRLKAEQAELLLEALQPLEAAMPSEVRTVKAYIQRRTAARTGWTFLMLEPDQYRAVMRWIRTNSARPMDAVAVWSELFSVVERDSGEIMLTREQLAELAGIAVQHVSNVMGELESIGAIIRHRERVAGMRGPGRVRYFMNPLVATHLAGAARDDAQAAAPPAPLLRLMAGGKAAGSD